MEMTLTWKCFLNVRLMDAKIRLFFKRSFNGRKDKTVFYILKMFNKNILENPSYISLIYSNSVY
ncbi:hypothetical protein DXD58_11315 [Bacteroides sp. D20]|nr:hypothetical protein DXD58_11315 [Bacteroides sp. D20]